MPLILLHTPIHTCASLSQALWSLADRSYIAASGGPGGDAGAAAEATGQLRSALAVLSMAATQRPQTVLDHLDLLLKVGSRPLIRICIHMYIYMLIYSRIDSNILNLWLNVMIRCRYATPKLVLDLAGL